MPHMQELASDSVFPGEDSQPQSWQRAVTASRREDGVNQVKPKGQVRPDPFSVDDKKL